MDNDYIEVLNENMSKFNPELHKTLKKKLNKRDIAIFYLLSHGKSMVFISDSSSRTKLFNSFARYEIEYLVCDFEEDIRDESFLRYVIEDFNILKDYPIDELLQKKTDLELKINALSTPYSNLKLLPHAIKEKKEYYLNKLNNIEISSPINDVKEYDSDSIVMIENDIKDIIEKYGDVFNYEGRLSQDLLKSEDYHKLVSISNSFKKSLNEFISLNDKLNKLLGLSKFNDLNSLELLQNLHVFSENCLYVDQEDRYGINEILKIYFKSPSIDLSSFSLINKYSIENHGLLESIEINVKYSELIDNNIRIDDKKRGNFPLLRDKINILVGMSKYLKKQLYEFSKFFERSSYFDSNFNSFDIADDFDEINNFFEDLFLEIDELIEYNEFLEYDYINDDEKSFIELVASKEVDKNIIEDIFLFNIYNSLFNYFLKEFDYIDENKLRVEEYQQELDIINEKLGVSSEDQQFINLIKYSSANLNNTCLIIEQKEDLDKKITNGDCDSILDILKQYKEFIMANRRIFLIGEESIPTLSKINYYQDFDYIIKGDEIIRNKG